MRKITYLCRFVLIACLAACSKEDRQTSIPVIETLKLVTTELQMPDSIVFSSTVSDGATPLSTLEVEVFNGNKLLVSRSIRTKGGRVELVNQKLLLPFLPNVIDGANLTVRFTLINIDGNEAKQDITLKVKRPALPGTLYLKMTDGDVPLLLDSKDRRYKSEEGEYLSMFSALLSTDEDLEQADYIWKAGQTENKSVVGDRFSDKIKISYPKWLVSQIIFDPLSFSFTVAGSEVDITVAGNQMESNGAYFYSKVSFTKGAEFAITGIEGEQLKAAYNRDFFEYNTETGKCKFTGETGTWEVYYSLKYNYFWIAKMNDVAPATYWIVGHGFTCASQWNADFNKIGWDLDDIKQLGYMKPLGGNKYQATIYLSDQHDEGGFDIQIYSKRKWEAVMVVFGENSFTGDNTGIAVAGKAKADMISASGFVIGYYRLTVDLSGGFDKALVDFKRIAE